MKMDMLKILVESTGTDVIVISETWLSKSVSDKDVAIEGFNIFGSDRPRKVGGMAIYVRSSLAFQIFC